MRAYSQSILSSTAIPSSLSHPPLTKKKERKYIFLIWSILALSEQGLNLNLKPNFLILMPLGVELVPLPSLLHQLHLQLDQGWPYVIRGWYNWGGGCLICSSHPKQHHQQQQWWHLRQWWSLSISTYLFVLLLLSLFTTIGRQWRRDLTPSLYSL